MCGHWVRQFLDVVRLEQCSSRSMFSSAAYSFWHTLPKVLLGQLQKHAQRGPSSMLAEFA